MRRHDTLKVLFASPPRPPARERARGLAPGGQAVRFLWPVLLLSVGALAADAPDVSRYDPLAIPAGVRIDPLDLEVKDARRQREIPIRVYLPPDPKPAPVVLFSHGLGGTRGGSAYLGRHWAARGYAVVALQHPGSDDSVWKDQPLAERWVAMNQAASAKNLLLRVKDVPAVLDRLAEWNREKNHPLAGRLDLERVGMSGHSFGAMTTQAVSGQSFAVVGSLADPRIRAAIAFSPGSPRHGDAKQAFGSVKIPWMLMTGTLDVAPIGDQDLASRLAVYPALPGEKYELVLHDARHSAFTDRPLPGEGAGRNPNHHRVILALSTAFWDRCLLGSEPARVWLQGEGPRGVLEEKDRWQFEAPPARE